MGEHFLTKPQASEFLTKSMGLPVATKTLSKLITVGGGPKYRKFRNRCVYLESDLKEWATAQLSEPRTNSTEEAQK